MAAIVRSKSCSFIPQDLPISELFLDINENRKKILFIEKAISLFAKEVAGELSSLKSAVRGEIKLLKAQISVLERDIRDLRSSLNGMEHQILQNSKDIKRLNKHLQELSLKVDSLSQTAFC